MELWVEKYRPQVLEDYVGNEVIKNKTLYILKYGILRHFTVSVI